MTLQLFLSVLSSVASSYSAPAPLYLGCPNIRTPAIRMLHRASARSVPESAALGYQAGASVQLGDATDFSGVT